MLKSVQKEDVTPVCPHCERGVSEIWFRTIETMLGKRYVYMCPSCKKVLGVTHRKGFWMG